MGVRVLWRTVPAATETWWWYLEHSLRKRFGNS
jgi:hypothetical protein